MDMMGSGDYQFVGNGATNFKYEATQDSNNRRSPLRVVRSEDNQLKQMDRRRLIATTRDLRRNFATLRWLIDKHLDFVVKHTLQVMSGSPELDEQVEKFISRRGEANNFDVTGRHNLDRFVRILEASRVVDGDVFCVKMRNGTLQAIEADRVRTPDGQGAYGDLDGTTDPDRYLKWVHGIKLDRTGRPRSYAVHSRQETAFILERIVDASRIIPMGYYDRFDQYRGVSPLAAAVNPLRDLHESYDLTLAKGKVSQMFALAINRDDSYGLGTEADPCTIDFSEGPQLLDLGPDEDAKFLSVSTPEHDTAAFWDQMIGLCLKSLGIPFSFYREDFTNFFGSKSAMQLYLKSVESKRADVVQWLDNWMKWQLRRGIVTGEISLPASFDIEAKPWRWNATGIDYTNPVQEVTADRMLIDSGLATRAEIRQQRYGDDWKDVARKLKEEQDLMEELGVRVIVDQSGEAVGMGGELESVQDTVSEITEPQEDENE